MSMRYSGLGSFGLCRLRIRFSASSSEKSTRLASAVLIRFSMISMRFSVSCWVVSLISWRNIGVLVRAATWAGVVAEPVMVENEALFGPWVSHLWCCWMWLMSSWLWLVLAGDARIMLLTPSFRVGLRAFITASWKLYRSLGLFLAPWRWIVFSGLATLLNIFHRLVVSSSIPARTATG